MTIADCPPSDSNPREMSTAGHTSTVDPKAFYNALWSHPTQGMYVLEVLEEGADFRFIDFNQACKDNSSIPVEEIQGQQLSKSFSPEVVRLYLPRYTQCVQTRRILCFEEKLPLENSLAHWSLTVYPLIDRSDKVTQLLVTAIDITHRKQLESLTESRQILQQVIDTVPAAIFWKDTDSRYLGCNINFAKIAGFEDVNDLVGKNDYDMVWKKEESDFFRECDRRVMDSDQSELNIIEPQLQPGGREAWLRTSKIPLHNSEGVVNGMLGVIEDITDWKEIQDKQSRLLAILEATPDIIGITDACGYHRYLNQAGQHMFNTSSEQVKFLHLADLAPPDIAEMLISEALPTAREKGIWSGESTIRNCHGQNIPVSHVIISHKSEEGLTERFSSMMRDISKRKIAETNLKNQSEELTIALQQLQKTQTQIIQAEKMSSLGQMVAGVAHEINNPVNFIHGNLQPAANYTQELLELIELYRETYPVATPDIEAILEDIDLDFVKEDLPKLLRSMTVGTERIREIVLSLRNFSRLDESEVKTVDLHDGINSTLVILNHRLKSDNVHKAIQVVKQYGDLPLVACYPSQLNQVLMNILANAIDALAYEKNPTITLSTEAHAAHVNIRIRDNGPGIPEEIQPQILDPFFTTKEVGKGTGMGMSISYQIVTEKHGGQLTFSSQIGQGTEFCISIPIQKRNTLD